VAVDIEDVFNQMRNRGMETPKVLDADGKKYTWAGTPGKPKKKNAWAILHEWTSPKSQKTFIVGVYGVGGEYWKVEPTETDFTPADKAAWIEKQKAINKQGDEERALLAETAREKALRLWTRALDNGVSEYLQRKKVGAYGIRFSFGKLLVPVRDIAETLHGLQWISPDGGKVFGTGTVKEGNFHIIGEIKEGLPIAFGEGYATCASVHVATGWPVIVCFDAGNLMPVVTAWRKIYPDHQFIVAGDDDKHLVARLCERLDRRGVSVTQKDFSKSAGGLRDMRWDLPDGRAVSLKAKWAKDRNDVYYIEGAITEGDVSELLRLENAGRAKGFAAAKKVGGRLICPRFGERSGGLTDFNDLHVAEGIEVVRAQLTAQPENDLKKTRANSPPPGDRGPNNGRDGGGDDEAPRLRFPFLTDKWEIKGIRENVYFAMHHDPLLQELVKFNEFTHRLDKVKAAPWGGKPGKWTALDDLRLAHYLADRHELILANPLTVQQAVLMAANDLAYNPMVEYFDGLTWDNIPRLDHWLADIMGAEQSEYTAKAGAYFLMSMVARVYEPGCQMDYMLVLQGSQGAKKSSVLRILAGEYYAGGTFRIGDKDSMQVLQGRLLFNFNELDSMGKAESTAVKSFVTERTDVFRAPYATSFSDFPRNCVLTGDTNQDEFLKDATGDRRCWPVHCTEVNPELMAQQRDALFAEAVARYREGERRYPEKDEEIRLFLPEQEKWTVVDVWEDVLASYVNSGEKVEGFDGTLLHGAPLRNCERTFFSTQELMTKALKQDVSKIDRAGSQQRSVASAMRSLGFKKDRWPTGRNRSRGYVRPTPVPEDEPVAPPMPAPAGEYGEGYGS
jgi:putative DNA primase/helicase